MRADEDGRRERRDQDIAAIVSASLTFVWVAGIGWLVSRPQSYYEKYNVSSEALRHVSRPQVVSLGAIVAVIVGVTVWWLTRPRGRPSRPLIEVVAWLLSPAFLLSWYMYARWPVAFPASEGILGWHRDGEMWLAAAAALGATMSVVVALTVVRARDRGRGLALGAVALGYTLVGSGIGRPREITANIPIAEAHWPGTCGQLYGGVHVATVLLVAGVALAIIGLACSMVGVRRRIPWSAVEFGGSVVLTGAVAWIVGTVVGWPVESLGPMPCIHG